MNKVLGVLLGAILLGVPQSAFPHTAPSGWVYPNTCCRDHMDCQMVPAQYIHFEEKQIRIELPPGVHRHAPNGLKQMLDYTNSTIRPSGDGDMHVCIGKSDYTPGADFKPLYRCLYITGGS